MTDVFWICMGVAGFGLAGVGAVRLYLWEN